MKITAVVPIRKGSQRVKDKNLRPFAGITLLENKLNTLLNVPELDQIIVNTNSDEAIEIVKAKYADSKIRSNAEKNTMPLRNAREATSSVISEKLQRLIYLYIPLVLLLSSRQKLTLDVSNNI